MSLQGRELFLAAIQALGLQIEPHLERFSLFQSMLMTAGQQRNLTSILEERDIVLKHFADSLSCLNSGLLDGPLKVLDIGTGAGFPGLPLAIVRADLSVDLLDSTTRKIDFVNSVIGALKLPNTAGIVGRAEWLGRQPERRGSYDRVVTRAVSALSVLVELSLPLLAEGGVLIAQKGAISEVELQAGRQAAAELGGVLESVQSFELPILNDPRTLVCVRKTRPTPDKYPRREGMPSKHPLF
jgi:16S rRNA (guanine527-N7)-methyltransferase